MPPHKSRSVSFIGHVHTVANEPALMCARPYDGNDDDVMIIDFVYVDPLDDKVSNLNMSSREKWMNSPDIIKVTY